MTLYDPLSVPTAGLPGRVSHALSERGEPVCGCLRGRCDELQVTLDAAPTCGWCRLVGAEQGAGTMAVHRRRPKGAPRERVEPTAPDLLLSADVAP